MPLKDKLSEMIQNHVDELVLLASKKKDYIEAYNDTKQAWDELLKLITNANFKMLDAFDAGKNAELCIISEFCYKQGVKDGMNLIHEMEGAINGD